MTAIGDSNPDNRGAAALVFGIVALPLIPIQAVLLFLLHRGAKRLGIRLASGAGGMLFAPIALPWSLALAFIVLV
jgi:hypothetical protein